MPRPRQPGEAPLSTEELLCREWFRAAGVGWLALGVHGALTAQPGLASAYVLGGGLGLGGALALGRQLGPRAAALRPHLAAALFSVLCVIPPLAAERGEGLVRWGLLLVSPALLAWRGWRAAAPWGLASAALLGWLALRDRAAPRAAGPLDELLPALVALAATLRGVQLLRRLALVQRDEHLATQGRLDALRREATSLRAARQAALDDIQRKGQFLATMSHELRTPLNAILGMTHLLADTNLTDEQTEYTTTIEAGGQALRTLIGDILDLSKIEAGKLDIERSRVDLLDLAEQALGLVCAQAHGKGLGLHFEPHPQAPTAILSDPARLQQILVNLLSNAVKFTDHGEVRLLIGPGSEPDQVVFSVVDTGVGIPQEKLSKLFQPFSQLDASRERQRAGTGLGLAISNALVGLLGGAFSVESQPGRGTTFSFSLRSGGEVEPARISQVAATSAEVLALVPGETERRILADALGGLVGRPTLCSSSAEFLSRMTQADRIDLLIIDPRSPGEEPIDLLRQLATLRQRPPAALLLSPKGAPHRGPIEAYFQSHFRAPGSAIVLTPLWSRQLLSALQSALHGESTERSAASRATHPGGDRQRILVAEDNPINQRVISKMLGKLGHEVFLVDNGQLAIDALREQQFDLVLMDVQMPVMDGLEATRRIIDALPRKARPRIVGLTANALAGDRETCLAAGMDDYLTKPIQPQDLIRALTPGAQEVIGTTDVLDPHIAMQLRSRYPAQLLAQVAERATGDICDGGLSLCAAFEGNDLHAVEALAGQLRERCAEFGLARLYTIFTKIELEAGKGNGEALHRHVGRVKHESERARTALLRLASSSQLGALLQPDSTQ